MRHYTEGGMARASGAFGGRSGEAVEASAAASNERSKASDNMLKDSRVVLTTMALKATCGLGIMVRRCKLTLA